MSLLPLLRQPGVPPQAGLGTGAFQAAEEDFIKGDIKPSVPRRVHIGDVLGNGLLAQRGPIEDTRQQIQSEIGSYHVAFIGGIVPLT